ncbi:TraX family protein [Paenibacillus sp. NFR01]|uniref:TraX family protein n=1 Tax=Paenibacillus sp. NFR01 TaxID=1566279 RepID=UPI0034A181A0
MGYIFFPRDLVWREIGRIAFPLYCYALVLAHQHTSSRSRHLVRLLLIALLSQIPYNLALDPAGWNVVFSLLLSGAVLLLLDKYRSPWIAVPVILGALVLMDRLPFDYNAYGLLLVLIFRYLRPKWLVPAHFALNLIFLFYYGWLVQLLSIIPTIFIAYTPALWRKIEGVRAPRLLWRSFYPVHLTILAVWKILQFGNGVSIDWRSLINI